MFTFQICFALADHLGLKCEVSGCAIGRIAFWFSKLVEDLFVHRLFARAVHLIFVSMISSVFSQHNRLSFD